MGSKILVAPSGGAGGEMTRQDRLTVLAQRAPLSYGARRPT